MFRIVLVAFVLFISSLSSVSAQEIVLIYNSPEFRVDSNTPFLSQEIDVSLYKNLALYFEYDTRDLDATPTLDTLTYGADSIEFGTILGKVSRTDAEIGATTTAINATDDSLQLFFRVLANSATSDFALISNLRLTGELKHDGTLNTEHTAFTAKHGKVRTCHFEDSTGLFLNETVNMMSIVGGKGHGQHGDDIIPPFWYVNRGGVIVKYPGNDWNQTGKSIYADNCLAKE